MNLSDIRLVCSDLDGTLLPNMSNGLSDEIFPIIRELKARGVQFCPASGRQFASLQRLFAPVVEDCLFMCDNGAVLFDAQGKLLAKTTMPRALAMEIAHDFWEGCDGQGEVTLSGENTLYVMSRRLGGLEALNAVGSRCVPITAPEQVPEEIVKVSIYLPGGALAWSERFVPRWAHANATLAGPCWIDTTFSNKGTGVEALCRVLNIRPEQVLAFGDNYNDQPMLDAVGWPFIMETAHPPLRVRYPRRTRRPEDTLRALLDGAEL
ncbi:MAG: HAD-IIB family hydrolase [Oscillospiraceae bacterium]|nr:HAD-IIB family hydrolase [Oscillospiraceae bacterium]